MGRSLHGCMKTKSFLLALSAVALGFLFLPSEAQAGGRGGYYGGGCGYRYNTYRAGCYTPVVVRPVRVVRPYRVAGPGIYIGAPGIRIGIGFGGGGYCRY